MTATTTTDTPAAPLPALRINYSVTAEPDTFDEREYADLCDAVAATHTGFVPLPVTVQMVVTGRYLSHQERWLKEAEYYLSEYGVLPLDCPAPMRRA